MGRGSGGGERNMMGVVTVRKASVLVRAVGVEDESKGFPFPCRRPLSFSKPSWVVRTESNVRKQVRKKPDPPCVVCQGTGRVHCHQCRGKGRTNCVNLSMLPKGEWPKWCRSCGGSGLGYCSRCLGTGEYRYIMGFHFMKMHSDDNNQNQSQPSSNFGTQSAADRFLKGPDSDQ